MISRLKKIFGVNLTTIHNRSNAWDAESFAGLYDRKERKSVLTPEIKEKITELITNLSPAKKILISSIN